jgi:hypothetical protein
MLDEENPYAPPKSQLLDMKPAIARSGGIWRDGNLLMVRKGVQLPDRCLKCNAPADGYRFHRNLSWISPFWYLGLLVIGPLIFVIIYYIVRNQGEVTAGLCPIHRARRRRWIWIAWITALLGLVVMLIPTTGVVPQQYTAVPVLAGIALVFAGLLIGAIGPPVLVPDRIDKHFVWLKRVSPTFLATLPDWKDEGIVL